MSTPADDRIRVAELEPRCTTLGPGRRFVLWVQGCPLDCRGCVSPQWIPRTGGQWTDTSLLARRIAEEAEDGLTVSGGEPFAQAAALARLVAEVRAVRDLSVLCYSGYTLGHLRRHGSAAQLRLLGQLDVLIDGPYLARRHRPLRWRGSDNQRIRLLTPRHLDLVGTADTSAGLEFSLGDDGTLRWSGVPARPGFREDLEQRLSLVPGPTRNRTERGADR